MSNLEVHNVTTGLYTHVGLFQIKHLFNLASARHTTITSRHKILQKQRTKITKTGMVRSRNHYGRGKSISITYTECVCVALVFQHAKRMRHAVICGLSDTIIFLHIIITRHDFLKKSTKHKMCFGLFYNFALNISHSKNNSARYKCTQVFM
jgi:hypothetical protein